MKKITILLMLLLPLASAYAQKKVSVKGFNFLVKETVGKHGEPIEELYYVGCDTCATSKNVKILDTQDVLYENDHFHILRIKYGVYGYWSRGDSTETLEGLSIGLLEDEVYAKDHVATGVHINLRYDKEKDEFKKPEQF